MPILRDEQSFKAQARHGKGGLYVLNQGSTIKK